MIDLASETLLTIEKDAERLHVSKATLNRWITYGTKGIRLEAAKLGGRWRTSEEAIQRFSDCLTPRHEPATASPTPIPRSKQRQRHLELVDQKLDEWFGIRRCETCKTELKAPKGTMPKHERLWCPNCLVQRKSAGLGQRIRTFRWAAMLSKQKLSDQTRISVENISSYESDEKKPSETHRAKLIEALGEDLVRNLADHCQDSSKPGETALAG